MSFQLFVVLTLFFHPSWKPVEADAEGCQAEGANSKTVEGAVSLSAQWPW